jgi:hypothetical protein
MAIVIFFLHLALCESRHRQLGPARWTYQELGPARHCGPIEKWREVFPPKLKKSGHAQNTEIELPEIACFGRGHFF